MNGEPKGDAYVSQAWDKPKSKPRYRGLLNVNLTLEVIPALASGEKVLVTANMFAPYLIFDFLDRR